jgi:CRP/FNR family transcriptional regulator, cyclic AMP receptor protein
MTHDGYQSPAGRGRSSSEMTRVSASGRPVGPVDDPSQRAQQLAAARSSDLLESLSPSDRAALLEGSRIVTFRRGEMAVRSYDDVVAVVLSGALVATIAAADGSERVTDLLAPAATWGVAQVLASHRSAKCKALTGSAVLCIRGDRVRAGVGERPAIAQAALEVVAAEARTLRDESERLEGTSTSQRVALRLLDLVERWGADRGDGTVRIMLPMTQEILAAWVHASREATAKSLHDLRGAGIVATRPRELTILDPDALRSRATESRRSGNVLELLGGPA